MYIRTDYEISLCPAIRLAGGRSAENGPNLRQIQVATTSHRLYVIYSEVITTMSRLLSETLVVRNISYILTSGAKESYVTGEAVIEIVRQPQRGPLSRPRPLSRDGPDTCGPAYAGYLPKPFSKCRTWGSRGTPMIAPGGPPERWNTVADRTDQGGDPRPSGAGVSSDLV